MGINSTEEEMTCVGALPLHVRQDEYQLALLAGFLVGTGGKEAECIALSLTNHFFKELAFPPRYAKEDDHVR